MDFVQHKMRGGHNVGNTLWSFSYWICKMGQSFFIILVKMFSPNNWQISEAVRPLFCTCFNLSSLIYSCRWNIKYVLLNTREGETAEKGN